MRILFFAEFANIDSTAPGFAVRCLAISRHLSDLGQTVTLVSPGVVTQSPTTDRFRYLSLGQSRQIPARRTGPASLLISDVRIVRSFAKLMRTYRGESVIVAAHDPLMAFLVLLAARIGFPVAVFDVHDSWLVLEKQHSGTWKNRVRKLFERLAMQFATKITTVTPTLGRMIADSYGIDDAKIRIIYNGSEKASESDAVEKDIDILHLGSPRPYYDTEAFVDALSIASGRGLSLSVVFLGCDNESYVSKVKQKVSLLKLSSQVTFVPPAPLAEVPTWLARARTGLQTLSRDPAYRCAIAVKVFEYLAHGLPILHLGPMDGETAQLITAGQCGAAASDADGLAEILQRILPSSAELSRMSSKARIVAREFSWDFSAREMARVLGESPES